MGLGMFDTCDNSLMVYIFGPQRSRPFTQSVHSFVGAGFVAGILLSKPFLPQQKSQSGDVCPNNNLTEIGISNEPYNSPDDPQEEVLNPAAQNLCFFRKNARLLILKRLSKVTAPPSLWKHRKFSRNRTKRLKWPPPQINVFSLQDLITGIIWPYIIVSFWHFLTAIGFLILAFKGSEMPRYMTDTSPIQENTKNTFTNMKYWKSVIVMVFVYYALTCGLESFFQVSSEMFWKLYLDVFGYTFSVHVIYLWYLRPIKA